MQRKVQVWHDILGLYEEVLPRHTRRFATVGRTVVAALNAYDAEVRAGTFPTAANSARLDPGILADAVGSRREDTAG